MVENAEGELLSWPFESREDVDAVHDGERSLDHWIDDMSLTS